MLNSYCFKNIVKQSLKRFGLVLSLLAMFFAQLTPLQAAMVTNSDLVQQAQNQVDREQLLVMLDRSEVRQQLAELGVEPEAAKTRVANMTDAEVAQLNQNLAQLPAGAGVVGLIVLLFIVFLITDMLGATDIFPFVKSINN